MRVLSYSQIDLYLTCPFRYKLQYIDRLRPKIRWQFSFGTTLHRAAEFFFTTEAPKPPLLDALLNFYELRWISEGYGSPEEEARYRALGREILTRFWETHYPQFKMPLAVEKPFIINIEGIKLRGFIDRVDRLPSGNLAIIDYKSGYHESMKNEVEESLQLTLYQLAAETIWLIPVESLTLYSLRHNTPFTCKGRDKYRLEEARKIVLETAGNIAQGKFEPVESENCPCDFVRLCPCQA